MQVQAVVHAGTGENMMNQMATFCLGERVHPLRHWPGTGDQVQATRHKWLWTFANYAFTFRFVAIMNCKYSFIDPRHDGIDNFISSVNHYSKNTGCSLAEAFRELSLYTYKWLLNHFDKKKAHRIHRNVICHSLFWLAFAKAYWDWSKPGRHKYDPEKMARNLAEGRTTMIRVRDPIEYKGKVFVTLGQLFDDVCHQKLAMGVPCHPDYSKQEEEILTHLVKLARDKRNNTVWLPVSIPEVKQVLNPSHPWYKYDDNTRYGRRDRSSSHESGMAPLETMEQDPTQVSAPESTDTEMYQALEKDLLISNDYQAGLVRNATQALDQAVGDVRNVQFKEPDEEVECHRTPGQWLRAEGLGWSILKKETVKTATGTIPRWPHTSDTIPSGIGSPLGKHPGNRMPQGDFRLRFQAQLKVTYGSYTSLKQSSRKREHQTQPKPLAVTPTQSPLQKTGWLQSVVTMVQKVTPEQPQRDKSTHRDRSEDGVIARRRSDGTFMSAPYHLIGAAAMIAEQFVLYCTDRFNRDDFEDEVKDFGNVFEHWTAFIAHYCMVMAVYFEVAWVHGERWIFPIIPPEMEKMTSRRGATLPVSPKELLKRSGDDIAVRCLKRWRYFLVLMQFWKDEITPFQYGGIVRHDSKVLLYVMFRLKAVLKLVDFKFHHYTVKLATSWNDYARENLTSDQVTADRKAHQKTHNELTALKNWMQCRYQEEADLELEILQRIWGDVDRLLVHREDRRCHPGNEEEYHRMRRKMSEEQNKGRGARGAFDQERETCDQRRESESQEQQEYAREREEEIEYQQSEPYPSPMSKSDPPTRLVSPSQSDSTKAKTKVSMSEYRSRQLQQEAAREQEEWDRELERLLKEEQRRQRESIEFQKLELAHQHEIEIQQAEIARIKYEQEELWLEQECLQKEQEVNALISQACHMPVAFGSHTPCYDEHGQELDYHDDVPATSDSQEAKSWGEYFCQQEHDTNPCSLKDAPGGATNLEEEARILQGPTMKSTASKEAILLRDEETPTVDMRQFLAGLETLTPAMLSELSTHIEHLRQLATPLASTKST